MALPGVKLQHQMDDITWSKTSASNGWHYLVLESSIQWMALPRVRLQHPMDGITWSWESSIQWTALPGVRFQHPMDSITCNSASNGWHYSLSIQLSLHQPCLTAHSAILNTFQVQSTGLNDQEICHKKV